MAYRDESEDAIQQRIDTLKKQRDELLEKNPDRLPAVLLLLRNMLGDEKSWPAPPKIFLIGILWSLGCVSFVMGLMGEVP